MSKNVFLHKNNMATLWDVITDEDIFKKQTVDVKNNILQIFFLLFLLLIYDDTCDTNYYYI